MKSIILGIIFFTLFCAFGCNDTPIDKPKNLIPEATMEAILYELLLFQGIKIIGDKEAKQLVANRAEYIYKKYKIDSTQLAESHIYYASKPALIKAIYRRIGARANNWSDSLEVLKKNRDKKTLRIEKTDPASVEFPK